MSRLAEFVKSLREQRGWNQQELADRVGLARTSLTEREKGNTRIKPPEREKFAKAFGMSLEEFDSIWQEAAANELSRKGGIPVLNRGPAGQITDYSAAMLSPKSNYQSIDEGQLDYSPDLFALIITDDSLSPTLIKGDSAVFSPMDKEKGSVFVNGAICLVEFAEGRSGDRAVLAKGWFQEDSTLSLGWTNSDRAPIVAAEQEVSRLSVCIEQRRKIHPG